MSIIAPRYSLPPPTLEPRSRRGLAILEHQIRERYGALNVVLIVLLAIVSILPIVLNFYLEGLVGTSLLGASGRAAFFWPVGQQIWFFLLILLTSSIGAAIIARDVATKAMTMYLARPIRPLDYLAAKSGAVAFWVFLGGVLPGWIASVLVLALGYVSLPVALEAAGGYLVVGVLAIGALTGLSVLLSSLTPRSTLAGAGIFGLLLGSYLVMQVVAGISGRDGFLYASPIHDIVAVGSGVFGASESPLDPWSAGAVLAGVAVVAFVLAYRRLLRAQVVAE
ncbi:MAG TPA: ABC transporter permease subunit [Thermoplasmata archaeon]|nr:ABC transporter permease subunit [Thermoplasmata archaeon]